MKRRNVLALAIVLAFSSIGFAQSSTPTFTQYAVKVERIKNVTVNLKSHKNARMFRTNLRNAATWGCGTNCSQSAIIDARNGRVFFPDQLEGAGFGFCDLPDDTEPIVHKANSRLLILSGFKGGDLDRENGRCGIYYLEWAGTSFRVVNFIEKKRLDTP